MAALSSRYPRNPPNPAAPRSACAVLEERGGEGEHARERADGARGEELTHLRGAENGTFPTGC